MKKLKANKPEAFKADIITGRRKTFQPESCTGLNFRPGPVNLGPDPARARPRVPS